MTEIRPVSMLNRAMIVGIAESMDDEKKAAALVNAVRCCDEFPECSHILEWVETREEPVTIPEADRA